MPVLCDCQGKHPPADAWRLARTFVCRDGHWQSQWHKEDNTQWHSTNVGERFRMTIVMQILIVAAAALGGAGVYCMMPRGAATSGRIGSALVVTALPLLWIIWVMSFRGTGFGQGLLFCLLGSMTVIGGVMTVTRTNPVSCALWFTSVVIGTAGLFMLENAQFLAAAIVIVYAGAIIVMFLFVVMMAQPHGTAVYDQIAREPALAVISSCVLLIMLASSSVATYRGDPPLLAPAAGMADVSEAAALDTAPDTPQVASLGRALFTDHWLGLEVAGTMLLVAMVGAILISSSRSTIGTAPRTAHSRPGETGGPAARGAKESAAC
jgi:NADH-quinone oxidoreductase subunit J